MPQQTSVIEKTWDEERLRVERLARLQTTMQAMHVGALILTDWENGRYAINTRIPSSFTVVPAQGRCIAFVRPMDSGYVSLAGVETRPITYDQRTSDPDAGSKLERFAATIKALMVEIGAAGETIAVDELDPPTTLALDRAGLRLASAQDVLQRAAAVKTQDEVLIYWQTGKIEASLMGFFREELEPGRLEGEIARRVYSRAIELGAEDLLQINVCAGEDSYPWRRWPTSRPIREGDLVGMDLHVHGPGGYVYDASHTYLCGSRPTARQREVYRRAHDYNNACIDLLRPGLAIPEFVERLPEVPEAYQEAVYAFHILHGNGLRPGGYPNVVKQRRPVDDLIVENQIVSLDCYFAAEGDVEAVKLEELVLITNGGAVKMADLPYDERLL